MIATLHDLNLAIRFADRLVVLNGGKLADGPRAEVITSETIRGNFEIDAVVHQADDGVPYVLPQSMRAVASPR